MRRRLIVPAVAIAIALGVAGCSSSGLGSTASLSGGVAQPGIATAPDAGSKDAAGVSSSSTIVDRQIITTGVEVIRTKNPIAAADKAASIVDAAGGRVDDRAQTAATRTTPADATLTLRIPSAVLTDTLGQLKTIGTVVSISESTDDVTTQSEDLNARINALQTSITRLLALESKAHSTADLITLEGDISDRQGKLESLTAQQKTLADEVSMSTIKLHLIAPSVVIEKAGPPTPGSAFVGGLSGFGTFFTWAFLVLLFLLPWLVLAAAIWIGIVFLVRWRRRRAFATTPPPPPAV